MTLPTDYKARKEFPLMTFLTAYFPDAIEALVELSIQGNVQHEISEPKVQPFYLPGDRIAWDRSKSTEEMETMMRHAWDHMRAKRNKNNAALYDSDGHLHCVKAFWRAGAEVQKTLEMLRTQSADSKPEPEKLLPAGWVLQPDADRAEFLPWGSCRCDASMCVSNTHYWRDDKGIVHSPDGCSRG